jgi:NADH:ubiquinone oxidoreductase subunit E
MSGKVKITVCAGTTCHVMGGAHLYDLENALPESLRDRVEIEGIRCLGFCTEQEKHGRPPYVIVDGETLADASLMTVLEKVKQRLVVKDRPGGD